MPLFAEREVAADCRLAIWQITETEEWFTRRLVLDDAERNLMASIRHPQRRLHWLSSRWLIRLLLHNPPQHIALRTDERGKPYLVNFSVHISISHSADLSALLLSPSAAVGLDLEYCSPKIERIARKFLSRRELDQLPPDASLQQLYVYWCVKEALYKLYGRRELDFRRHLYVEPFIARFPMVVQGHINKPPHSSRHAVTVEAFGPYLLAWVVATASQNHNAPATG
ncbi:MAG: 4'-phosphopantetheinyl transferase superfamily protein [Chitinophagales bacterium]|nr:4'-phosphopantetheinyl transferase superfamily protein [Chitinophagales bacterium]MDW8393328.1 4'-phosphopantetheinyl transferase superfamily protein [Chitinophagales bacterium]